MNFLYAFLTIVLLCGAAGVGWWLCARRARQELASARELAARRLSSAEESVRQLGIELSRARSECDGLAQAREDEGEARDRLEGELAAARATELARREELTRLGTELAARAASLELARAVAREAEEVRDAQAVELADLRTAATAAEQRGAGLRAEEERRRAEQASMASELAQLRAETVRVRREAAELRQDGERQAAALAAAAQRLAQRETELAELSARLERTAGEVVAADERAHRLESELESLRQEAEPVSDVRLVPEPENEPKELPEPRPRRTRVVVPVAGQGDLWAE